jgi:hypothetical protein
MKKGVLFLIGLFVVTLTSTAANTTSIDFTHRNRTINFVENGIAFTVFTNGNFNYSTDVFNYRNGRRYRQNIIIDRDYRGRINFINNIPIRYNRWDNVTRIGEVIINYNRGRIINVGHLSISYNHFGEPIFFGNVRRNNINLNIYSGRICSYNDPFFYGNDFRRNYRQFRRDRNFVYYKNRSNNIVRRRVANNVRNNNNIVKKQNRIVRNNTITKNNNRNKNVRKNNTTVTKRRTTVTRNNNGNNTRRSASTKRRSS